MFVISLIFSVLGVGFFCWLLFTLAIYVLPFFAGLTSAVAAFHNGAGAIGAFIVGVIAGGATLSDGQIAFATVRTPLIRAAIGLLYSVPAAIDGYSAAHGLAQIGVPSEGWRKAFATVGAVLVGGTAWARMTVHVSLDFGQGTAVNPDHRLLTAATETGEPARRRSVEYLRVESPSAWSR